jgi:hypothetical protein
MVSKTINHPNITTNLNHKYLHQLLLFNITTLEQITLPNRTTIMNEKEFQQYHKKPTPTIKKALKIASHLFYTSICTDTCKAPCNTHQQSYTLLPEIANRPNQNFNHNPLPENNSILAIQEPPKAPKKMQKLQDYPITTITNTKQSQRKDNFGTIKMFTSYKCTWRQPENQNYTMWMNNDKVFPHNNPNIASHNLILLKRFYIAQQHKHYSNKIEINFSQIQSKDTRYVHEPLNLPLIQINLHECNPDKDIKTTQPTIQIIQEEAHIFTDIGNLLITIPKTRLEWLWKQYNANLDTQHQLDPPIQPFTTEIIWLYERYKYRIPKTNPLKKSQYTLLLEILDLFIETFKITTSYFSSVTFSTKIDTFYSPFQRDSIFGFKGSAYIHKWKNVGYAHPHNTENTHKAIH